MKFYIYYCTPEGYGGFLYGDADGGYGYVVRLTEAAQFPTKKLAQAAIDHCVTRMRRPTTCYTIMRTV